MNSRKFANDKLFCVLLEDGHIMQGKYIEIPHGPTSIKKVFFKTPDGKKEFSVKNLSVNMKKPGWQVTLKVEINDYLNFLLEQSKLEFPEWIKNNGRHSFDDEAVYSVDEIGQEWKSMKSLFGAFRMAGDCGFFTSRKPFESTLNKIVEIREN